MKKVFRAFAASNPVLKAAAFAIVAMLMVVISVFVALQPPFTSLNWLSPIMEKTTASFGANQGILLSTMTGESLPLISGDVLILVPGGVVAGGGTVVFEHHQPDILGEAGEPGWTRPQILNVELLDHLGRSLSGMVFDTPIDICFVLQEAQWQHYQRSPSSFDVQFYDEAQSPPRWQSLPTLAYGDRHLFCGQLSHLTLIALAIRGEPPPPGGNDIYTP